MYNSKQIGSYGVVHILYNAKNGVFAPTPPPL